MFTWICGIIAVVLVLVTVLTLAFAMQEHSDRVLSEETTETASQYTGARIMNIRDADMTDRNDYIRAFSEIEPLLDTYKPRVAEDHRSLQSGSGT